MTLSKEQQLNIWRTTIDGQHLCTKTWILENPVRQTISPELHLTECRRKQRVLKLNAERTCNLINPGSGNINVLPPLQVSNISLLFQVGLPLCQVPAYPGRNMPVHPSATRLNSFLNDRWLHLHQEHLAAMVDRCKDNIAGIHQISRIFFCATNSQ